VRNKATQPNFLPSFLNNPGGLFDLLLLLEWLILWAEAITTVDSNFIQHPTKITPLREKSTFNTPLRTCLRLRQLLPCSYSIQPPNAGRLHLIAWRFSPRLPPTPSRALCMAMQRPAEHRLRSFRCTAMTRLPSFLGGMSCLVNLSASGRRRRATIVMLWSQSRSGIVSEWLGGSIAARDSVCTW
jgi:hypothetical protein